jgi:hypothetical protein
VSQPILRDPGNGRTWLPELRGHSRGLEPRWGAELISRTGWVLGYIAQYDNGWGANSIVRGKRKSVGYDGYQTAQEAADALLKARKIVGTAHD